MRVPAVNARRPVFVGVSTAMQCEADPQRAIQPLDLMFEVVCCAGREPVGAIRQVVGTDGATTVSAGQGVLQQTLTAHACDCIAAGDICCALLAGADTGFHISRARQSGLYAAG